MRVRAQQGDTIDALCWRHYGRTRGLVEVVLEMNPGIADNGPVLPHGLVVEMPEPPNDQPNTPLVNLWD
jgi:phage tail protein X